MSIKSSYTLIISLFTISILSGTVLSSTVSATDTNTAQDNVAVNVPVSCTMNGTGMTSHNANIPNGTYQADIGTTTLKSFCNDSQGFAIYAIGYTNEEYGNTNLIGTSGGQTIVTGTATTTGSPDVSNWAVKLATDSTATYPITLDNSFGAYSSVPSTYTKVAHRDSGTDLGSSATGASLTTTYAAYISKTQQADTYNGKVKYTLVHPSSEEPLQPQPATAGCINYFANTSSAIGEMGCQSATNNVSVDLWASNFKREGYGFAGWNDKFDYSGTNYGPNQTITAPADIETNGLSLYAIWIKSANTIQDWSGCSSLAQGSVTALTDSRDNNTYAVAKLADGKCWMIENLRLDNTPELSSTNTHNPSLPLTNVYNSTNPTTSNHLSATKDPTRAPWCTSDSSYCDDQSMLATNNTTLFTNNTAANYSASGNVYSYGNYYNWYSATGGHGKYGFIYGSYYHAPGDICPAGWRLPKGAIRTSEANNEFWSLIVTGLNNGVNPAVYDITSYPYYTDDEAIPVSNALRSYPNNFVYSGAVSGSSVSSRNSSGNWWSASEDSSYGAYVMGFGDTYVFPGTGYYNKYGGRMVRCIAGV